MDVPSDSDDSIIFIPYVKPPIPVLVVDDEEVINIDGNKEQEIAGPSNQKQQRNFSSSSSSTNSYPTAKSTFDNNNTLSTQDVIETENSSLQCSSNRSSTPENKKNKTPGKSNNNDNSNSNNNNNRNAKKIYDIDRKGSYGPSTFPYTFTDSEKRTDLLYEKIVNVVQKQKLEKKLMLERVNQSKQACLEQVKNLTKPKTPDSNPSSSTNTTSPQKNQKQSPMVSTTTSKDTPTTTTTTLSQSSKKKTRTKRRRDDSGSLSAAELDHYNFLKTLNLTANIGLDENEMLALGRNQTKTPRKKRTKKSNNVIENNIIIHHHQDQQPIYETSLQYKINNESNPVSKSSDLILQNQDEEKQDIPLINSGPSTSTSASKSCTNLDDATCIQFVSIIDESVGKNNNKKKNNVRSSTKSLINLSSSSLTMPSPTTSTTPVNKKQKNTNNKKVSEEIVIISSDSDDADDDEENHGIFTRQELDKLQSNIRLNISGGGDNRLFTNNSGAAGNSQQQARKSLEKLSAKKSFRYFQTTPKTTQQCQNDDNEDDDEDSVIESDKESIHDNSSCSSTSEAKISAGTTTSRTTSKNRFIKNKLKELKRKSSDTTPTKMSKQQKMPQSKRTKFDEGYVVNSESSNDSGSDVDSVSSSSSLLIRPMSYSKRHKTVDDLDSTLTNDPPTDRLFPTTWTESMKEYYGQIRNENLDVADVLSKQPDYRGFWAAPLDPDYSSNFRGRSRVKCDNCQQWGHVKNRCPEPVKVPSCLMCGEEMHTTPCFYSNDQRSSKLNRTTPSRCPNTSCLNCGKSGTLNRRKQGSTSRFVQSCEMCSTLSNHHGKTFKTCRNCNQHGHIASICPEDWRRFHSTTTPDSKMEKISIPPNAVLQKAQYKSRQHQYCSNCGKKNHMYFNCGGSREFNSYLPSTPYINNELPLCLKQFDLPSNAPINTIMTPSSSITLNNNFNSTPSSITPSISNDLQYMKTGTKSSTATTETVITTTNEENQSINEPNNPKSKSQQRNSCNEIQTSKVVEKDSNNSFNNINSSSINEVTTLPIEKSSSRCPDFPHCTNTNEKGQICHSIHLSKEEYQLIFKLNQQINVLTQLKTDDQTCSVCLVEKSSSFHLYGSYDDSRDKIFQLLYKLKTEGVELYVQTVLQSDKIINNKEIEGKTLVLETQKASSSTNPEISNSSSALQEKKDEEHSDPGNESDHCDPVLYHKKTIINDNLNVEESTKETVSNSNIDNLTTNCNSVDDSSNPLQDESEIFIEPEIDIIMNRKITITNERALTVTSSLEKTDNNNVTALHESISQEISKDDAMTNSTFDKTTTTGPKNSDFEQIKPYSTTTTTTTAGNEQQSVQEANINIGEHMIGNQSSSSSSPLLSNVQNNTLNSKLKEVPTTSSSSNSFERNDFELPEIIHIEDDDDDEEEEDAIIVQEVSRIATTTTTTNKSPQEMERNRSKSPKTPKEKTTTTTTTTNNNNNNRKSQEHVSPVATINVNAAEWKKLLDMKSIEFLNSVRDEFNVQISAEKDKLSISISNNKWATLLNAKFKIHQWLLSKMYNNNTSNIERRDQYPKNNNRQDNRSRSTKNEEISTSSSSAGASSSSSRTQTITKNQDTRRESTNRQRRFQHDPQNNRGNGRGTGSFRGFRGPRSFTKNFNYRNQNGGF